MCRSVCNTYADQWPPSSRADALANTCTSATLPKCKLDVCQRKYAIVHKHSNGAHFNHQLENCQQRGSSTNPSGIDCQIFQYFWMFNIYFHCICITYMSYKALWYDHTTIVKMLLLWLVRRGCIRKLFICFLTARSYSQLLHDHTFFEDTIQVNFIYWLGGPQCSGSSCGQKLSWDTGANTVTWYCSPASCRWSEFTNTSKWVGGWATREHIQLARKLEVGKSLGRCSGTQRDRQGLIWSGISSQGKWCKVIRSEVGVCRHNESIFSSSSQDGRLTVADAAKLTPQSHPGDRQWPPSIS